MSRSMREAGGKGSGGHGAAEAGVAGGAVGGVGGARGDAVTVAVGVMAEEGAAANDAAIAVRGAGGVLAGEVGVALVVVGAPEVGDPFPDVSGGVVEAEVVGFKGAGGGGAIESVVGGVLFRELTLPDIAVVFAIWDEVVSPGVDVLFEVAAGGVFPFGFCGEAFAGPGGEGLGVVPGDVDDGVIHAFADIGARATGALPGGFVDADPPWDALDAFEVKAFAMGFGDLVLEDEGPAEAFGFGLVSGVFGECLELLVGDSSAVDQERVEGDFADGAFSVGDPAVGILGAHEEGAAIEGDHAFLGAGVGAGFDGG